MFHRPKWQREEHLLADDGTFYNRTGKPNSRESELVSASSSLACMRFDHRMLRFVDTAQTSPDCLPSESIAPDSRDNRKLEIHVDDFGTVHRQGEPSDREDCIM
jgi:hypothetical protein